MTRSSQKVKTREEALTRVVVHQSLDTHRKSMQRLLTFAFFLAYIARGHEDVGYELMFEDSKNETNWACWKTQNMPEWLNGSFILPTVGQFSFGGRALRQLPYQRENSWTSMEWEPSLSMFANIA